jgi:hypothetical protein
MERNKKLSVTVKLVLSLLLLATASLMAPHLTAGPRINGRCGSGANCCCNQDCGGCTQDSGCPSASQGSCTGSNNTCCSNV